MPYIKAKKGVIIDDTINVTKENTLNKINYENPNCDEINQNYKFILSSIENIRECILYIKTSIFLNKKPKSFLGYIQIPDKYKNEYEIIQTDKTQSDYISELNDMLTEKINLLKYFKEARDKIETNTCVQNKKAEPLYNKAENPNNLNGININGGYKKIKTKKTRKNKKKRKSYKARR